MARFIITGEYKDKATKAARKDLKELSKDTKKWSVFTKAAWGAASAAALYYSKVLGEKSIRAALANEKSETQLAFALKQVAGASDAATLAAEANVEAMSKMFGISRTEMRPALSTLVRLTGNTTDAFNGLNLALSLSGATGKDLQSTADAIGKAYQGNFGALKKLNVAVDANKIKNKDLSGILSDLKKKYGSFAKEELKSTATQFNKIKVAAQDASVVVGESLIKAFSDLSSQAGGVDKIVKSMEKIAYWASDFVTSITIAFEKMQADPILGSVVRFLGKAAGKAGEIANWVTAEGRQRRINLALIKSQNTQIQSLRNAEMTALNAKKKASDEANNAQGKTIEQLMAEEAARKAGFKLTEDLDSIQTVAAAKRLEESRQYKMSVLDAAQSQFEAIKNNYDLLNAVWTTQLAAFDVFLAALKTKAKANPIGLDLYSTYIGSGAAAMAPMAPPVQSNYLGFEDPLSLSMGYNQGSVSGAAQPAINVTVNAGAVGSEEYLIGVIGDTVAKYIRAGNSIVPAGFIQ